MIKDFLTLMRPEQWVKNGFILLAIFFGQKLTDWDRLQNCLVAFIGFSLVASSIYCVNDVLDAEADRRHREKKTRPVASGAVSKRSAILLAAALFVAGFAILFLGGLDNRVIGISLLYYVMNLAYSSYLKNFTVIDVIIISVGFVIRVVIGGFASGVHLSHWIVIMTFLLALFLAFAKRRDDVVIHDTQGIKVRRNVERYNLFFLNAVLAVTATIVIVSYIMYTISPEVTGRFRSEYLYVTSVFVIAGIFRYLQLTMVESKSSNPTKVLVKDRFIQTCVVGWLLTLGYIIYF